MQTSWQNYHGWDCLFYLDNLNGKQLINFIINLEGSIYRQFYVMLISLACFKFRGQGPHPW